MFRSGAVFLAIFGSILCLSPSVHGLGTVYDIDVNKYVGVWYQMYTDYWADFFTGAGGAECITATYGKISDTNVTVRNAYKNRDGKSDIIEGFAYIPRLNEPGKLLVELDGVPTPSPYWIIKLGPIVEDLYEYSVVTDSRDLSLFVLARNPAIFDELYDAEVREYLLVTGFTDPTTQPVRVYHGVDCEYI